jgi:hypothetical protein
MGRTLDQITRIARERLRSSRPRPHRLTHLARVVLRDEAARILLLDDLVQLLDCGERYAATSETAIARTRQCERSASDSP